MNEQAPTVPVEITVDLKKYRIRLFKTTLHLLKDPNYIQLLVNPEAGIVAIKSVDHSTSGDQTHRIPKASPKSIEIYSRSFVTKLIEVAGDLDSGHSYKMTGVVVPKDCIAVFSLKTLARI